MIPNGEPPAWLGRSILHDELRILGLPWCPDAWWRRPSDRWLTLGERHEAIAIVAELIDRIRKRIGPVPRELRDAAWRCVVAGLTLLPPDRWPTRRQADDTDEELPALEPVADPEDQPLVIRRRGDGGRHAT